MSTASSSYGLHWFRRDLRIEGNLALHHNWKESGGKVLGIFCFDSKFLGREDFSHNRFAFFIKTLQALRADLRAQGGDLLVIDELPHIAFKKLFAAIGNPSLFTFSRDYEPFARERDKNIYEMITGMNIPVKTCRDHLIIEPHELFKTKPGDYYQVYSPFARRWFELFETKEVQARLKPASAGQFSITWKDMKNNPYKDACDDFEKENNKKVTIDIPEAGSKAAMKAVKAFVKKLDKYKADRDFPSVQGTSKFSIYFKNGSLTTAQVITALDIEAKKFKTEDSTNRFLKELVWREFYYHILSHRPDVETQSFIEKYRDIEWKNDKELFKRWCEGTTGFPIVDAGMRELNTTGWMHNRVRMIVASFLCKDLLINWQWGEKYFMEKLLDGDLAPNNGGWQWAASTGCDPQPYFRIFNPWLQSAKFDPEGTYIKTYVPELKDIEASELHEVDGNRGSKYPKPVVEHAIQKNLALALYKYQNS